LKLRLDEKDVSREEQKQAAKKNIPGASQEYDPWDLLLREFVENNALDLRNKGVTSISPKLWGLDNLISVDFSQNKLSSLPEEIYYLRKLKSLRMC